MNQQLQVRATPEITALLDEIQKATEMKLPDILRAAIKLGSPQLLNARLRELEEQKRRNELQAQKVTALIEKQKARDTQQKPAIAKGV